MKKLVILLVVILAVFAGFYLFNYGNQDLSASGAAVDFFEGLNDSSEEAKEAIQKYYSDKMLEYSQDAEVESYEEDIRDYYTKNGSIDHMDLILVEEKEDFTEVRLKIFYNDETSRTVDLLMVQENGVWKIHSIPGLG